jgi:transposase
MSEKSADVVDGFVLRQGVNGRRTYSVSGKRALAELCRRPGVSVARMAMAHGVNANLLRRWMVRYSDAKVPLLEAAPRVASAVLVPVSVPKPRAKRAMVNAGSSIEITFGAATIRVRGEVDARVLNVVLDCLARRV